MELRKPRLNNMILANQRRDLTYEAIMTDLVLMGALDKEVVEKFTGVKFSELLKPPAGFILEEDEPNTVPLETLELTAEQEAALSEEQFAELAAIESVEEKKNWLKRIFG